VYLHHIVQNKKVISNNLP